MRVRELQLSPGPGHTLLRAAVSGLLGVGGVACSEKTSEDADPDRTSQSASREEDAGSADECRGEAPAPVVADAGTGDAAAGKAAEVDKEISTTDVQYTFAELSEMCDERNGFLQVHGSCGGVSTCRGFSYGDWEEESQLVEHSCSGVNGCAGLSCVLTAEEPAEGGLTGEEIMKLEDDWFTERAGTYGAKPCKQCHVPSEHNTDTDEYDYDFTKIRLLMWPDSNRDANNWTARLAKYQEAQVAFGVHGIREDGTPYSNMAPYKDLFSKAEIERVVKYMRDFDPEDIVIDELKEHPGKVE
jgi:hypothetical protein